MVEEWKWRKPSHPGVPVWSHQGGICTGETYKSVVKLTFFKGASLEDPSGLFNSSLGGNTRRAINVHEDEMRSMRRRAVRSSVVTSVEQVLVAPLGAGAITSRPGGGCVSLDHNRRPCPSKAVQAFVSRFSARLPRFARTIIPGGGTRWQLAP